MSEDHNPTESTLTFQARRISDLERRIEQALKHLTVYDDGDYDDGHIEYAIELLTVPPIRLDENGKIIG